LVDLRATAPLKTFAVTVALRPPFSPRRFKGAAAPALSKKCGPGRALFF
jgi:hypothetical protein